MPSTPLLGRGTALTPPNRFSPTRVETREFTQCPPAGHDPSEAAPPTRTSFRRDASRTILTSNASPDLSFRYSLNPYRGCEHGCVYCYARPSHETLGWNAGLDFETRISVKEEAPELLRKALFSPRWEPQTVALSGNTDCYQPVERRLGLTRRCLEVFAEFRNPVSVITKSALVTRDSDVLRRLARHRAARVQISLTTLDNDVARRLDPRAASPKRRLEAITELRRAGIPTTVILAPIIPGLTDEEIPRILEAAADAGALGADWTLLRLPAPVDELFIEWLQRNFPERSKRVLHRIEDSRGSIGKLSDSKFGRRMRGQGEYARQLAGLFSMSARRYRLDKPLRPLSAGAFRRPRRSGEQMLLL